MADLDLARHEAIASDTRVTDARAQLGEMERLGHDATDARLLLGHLEIARRRSIERLGAIRHAIGPSAY